MAPPAWDAEFRHQQRENMGKWLGHQYVARIMAAARAEALRVRLADNDWEQYYWRHSLRAWGRRVQAQPVSPTCPTRWTNALVQSVPRPARTRPTDALRGSVPAWRTLPVSREDLRPLAPEGGRLPGPSPCRRIP
ncbi:hypothetical protein ACTMU2_18320 [Cupriavidus basilensis]